MNSQCHPSCNNLGLCAERQDRGLCSLNYKFATQSIWLEREKLPELVVRTAPVTGGIEYVAAPPPKTKPDIWGLATVLDFLHFVTYKLFGSRQEAYQDNFEYGYQYAAGELLTGVTPDELLIEIQECNLPEGMASGMQRAIETWNAHVKYTSTLFSH